MPPPSPASRRASEVIIRGHLGSSRVIRGYRSHLRSSEVIHVLSYPRLSAAPPSLRSVTAAIQIMGSVIPLPSRLSTHRTQASAHRSNSASKLAKTPKTFKTVKPKTLKVIFSDRQLVRPYNTTLGSCFTCTIPVTHVLELEACCASMVDSIWNDIYARCQNTLTDSLRLKPVIYLCIYNLLNM